ncbi:MAG: DNA-binding protein WhiA, partial [Oscillospiraceae bacterium]
LLQKCEFNFKHIVRNSTQVLYIKSSTQIEDLLTTIGAPNASLEIMKFKIYRDFRNKANRMANCETANIGKIINANQTSIDAIKFLQQENALDYLTEDLKNTALMRLSNEEMSLADLAKIIKPTVSKSGLSHRFKKIEKIANEMKQKKETIENV